MERIATDQVQDFERRHLEELRLMSPGCMLFLRKNKDFPLEGPCPIAAYGSGVRNTIQGGTGSGEVNTRHFVTVEEGLEAAGFEITTKSWLFQYELIRRRARKPWVASVVKEAKAKGEMPAVYAMGAVMPEPEYELPLDGKGDVAIYVLARISGEGSDRKVVGGDFLLSETEKRDIHALAAKYPKFLLVLNVGGPVDLSEVPEVENILLLSQLGTMTGHAFADVLLGKANPSGKLTTTWAAAEDYQKIGSFDEENDTRYKEGIYVGYRYFEAAGKKPVYPFGFGLGYSEFKIEETELTVLDGQIDVWASIRNIGEYAGRETLQLYYSAPQGRLDQPVKQLGAYVKTRSLEPGDSTEVELLLPIEDMASYEEEKEAWVLEAGIYRFWLGTSSVDGEDIGEIRLLEEVLVEQAGHICGEPDFKDWKPEVSGPDGNLETAEPEEGAGPTDFAPLNVRAAEVAGKGHFSRNRLAQNDLLAGDLEKISLDAFSEEELVKVCIGNFKEKKSLTSMIGDQGGTVAGTAGESAAVIHEKGFGRLILADGPAGLRLARNYVLNGEQAMALGAGVLSSIDDFLPKPAQWLLNAKRRKEQRDHARDTIYHQYASAIPIGTALAQSWDGAFVRRCGEIVGSEMGTFGVNVWLAPALNIHRSVLCGRNFEYYSEDPVLAGRMAAAMTLGVQKNPKCAVTIKHFACNNQEFNRTHSNSVLSERALREIYLKGFEICVKEAQPHFIMTSYNLINGLHTANSRDLLTQALRKEWGFEGVVMTDWFTTTDIAPVKKVRVHGNSVASECIAACNDMIEPGTTNDRDQILKALNGKDPDYRLSREELETCARRILYWCRRLS